MSSEENITTTRKDITKTNKEAKVAKEGRIILWIIKALLKQS